MPKYAPGDVVEYWTFCNKSRLVIIEECNADIKNGNPGFSGRLFTDGRLLTVWGYDDQILRVWHLAE